MRAGPGLTRSNRGSLVELVTGGGRLGFQDII